MAISRRHFLIGSGVAGAGLILGFYLGNGKQPLPGSVSGSFQPNVWLQITPDGRFIFQLHKVEMGQGVMTTLAVVMAEELDIDPACFEIVMAGVHPAFVSDVTGLQVTGGSTSVSSSWYPLRHAGAAARAMLVAAAAQHWAVSTEQCATDNGEIINTSTQQRLRYADVAQSAKNFSDTNYQLKARSDYRWVGRDYPRLDSRDKTNGTAQFGIDVDLPGMKVAVIVRCPHFGGTVKDWQPDSVRGRDGVIKAFRMHSGIAIVANNYWQARKAAQQLQVEWDKGPLAGLDSAAILAAQQQALLSGDSHKALVRGDINKDEVLGGDRLQARYSVPYAHHSPMEPQNATALYTQSPTGNRCEVWAPNQAPDICQALIAHFGDVVRENAIVHTTLLGGGFGRRSYPDFVAEAVAVARELPGTPIKLIWSREDDMRHDFYRPSSLHALEGSLGSDGKIIGWNHILVAPSMFRGFGVYLMSTVLPAWVPTAVARSLGRFAGEHVASFDSTLAEGARIPYQIDNVSVECIEHDPGVPVGFWRSVNHSHNVFVVEGFIDELSCRAGSDPLEFRRQHLPPGRHRQVLELAAEKAGWGRAAEGIGQGIALSDPFASFCAMVAEVSVEGSSFSVERIVAAVDCGLVISPDIAKSQVESGIVYALSAAIKAPVTFIDGRAEQSNFHDLPVLRINEVPRIEVYLVTSEEMPTGLGEIAVPAVAPAVANALFAATGRRLRSLPLRLED